jgi:hypothetical protein
MAAGSRSCRTATAGTCARAEDEAYALIREALTASGDIQPADGELRICIEPFTAPRRTRALAALCQQLNTTRTRYPGTDLILRYDVKTRPRHCMIHCSLSRALGLGPG